MMMWFTEFCSVGVGVATGADGVGDGPAAARAPLPQPASEMSNEKKIKEEKKRSDLYIPGPPTSP